MIPLLKNLPSRLKLAKAELTDTAIRNAKPTDKQWKLSDKKGLFVLAHPNGSKYWRMKYRFAGKKKMLSLGVYPGQPEGRLRRQRRCPQAFSNGVDPGSIKKTNQAGK